MHDNVIFRVHNNMHKLTITTLLKYTIYMELQAQTSTRKHSSLSKVAAHGVTWTRIFRSYTATIPQTAFNITGSYNISIGNSMFRLVKFYCHPNYITHGIYPKSHTKTCCYMLIKWLLCIAATFVELFLKGK